MPRFRVILFPVARTAIAIAVAVQLAACTVRTGTGTPGATIGDVGTRCPSSLTTSQRAALELASMSCMLPARLDSIIGAAIDSGATPGAAVAVVRHGRVVFMRGYGRTDWSPQDTVRVSDSTLYDLASLTKVVGTTTIAMMLEETGRLQLDSTVRYYLPAFDAPDKAGITIRELLIHRGGLEAFAALFREFRGREQYLTQINARPLAFPPGSRTVYSDWDMILMQLVIERITGRPLDSLLHEMLFAPLGMRETQFNPPASLTWRVAPTEIDTTRGGLVRGFVHDENAWAIGGVAGHAGLFSTARDLAVFAQMMLANGRANDTTLLKPYTIARWTARQGTESSRAIGWDTPSKGSSAGRYFSPRSFGHTGFTGTSIWMDPEKQLGVILLTNRVNPTRANTRIFAVRRAVADAVQEAVRGVPLVDWEGR